MNNNRHSGIELLRIIAMLFILIQHANGIAIGLPNPFECVEAPAISYFRFLIQGFAIVGVDVFVLISGWFGINFNLKRVGEYLFQCLFFSIIITFIIWLISGRPNLDIKTLAGGFLLGKSYWFVKSYLLLYILSPVLNNFIDTTNKNEARTVLVLFIIIMILFGWSDSMPEFIFGNSCISFMGLYLIARYIKKYSLGICFRPKWEYACCYCLSAALLAAGCLFLYKIEAPDEITRCLFSFVNPLVVIGALSLLLLFSRIKFSSLIINKVAKSSFAVYLFHCGPIVWTFFLAECSFIYSSYNGIGMLFLLLLYLIAVFAVACLIDQFRLCFSFLLFKKRNE